MTSARITLSRPGPRNAANAMAGKIPGKDKNELISTMLMKRSKRSTEITRNRAERQTHDSRPKHNGNANQGSETRAPYNVRDKHRGPVRPCLSSDVRLVKAVGFANFARRGLRGDPRARKTASTIKIAVTAKPHRPRPLVRRNLTELRCGIHIRVSPIIRRRCSLGASGAGFSLRGLVLAKIQPIRTGSLWHLNLASEVGDSGQARRATNDVSARYCNGVDHCRRTRGSTMA